MQKGIRFIQHWGLALGLAAGSLFSLGAQAQELATAGPIVQRVLSREICGHDVAEGHARCHSHVVLDRLGQDRVTAAPSGLTPADLRAAYNVTGNGTSAAVIAVVDAYHYANAEADLAVYRAQFGLPACTKASGCFKQIDQNGGTNYPSANKGWSQEAALGQR